MPSSTWFENHLDLTAGIGPTVNTMLLPGTAAMMARVVVRPWSFSMKVLPMATAMLTRLILGSIFVMVTTVIAHGGGMGLKLVTVAAAMVAGIMFAPRQLIRSMMASGGLMLRSTTNFSVNYIVHLGVVVVQRAMVLRGLVLVTISVTPTFTMMMMAAMTMLSGCGSTMVMTILKP